MSLHDFDFGAELVGGGGSYKNPAEGDHMARLRALIHLGTVANTFEGNVKTPAPAVLAIFELFEDDDVDDDGYRLTIHKVFSLRQGKNAFVTKFLLPALCTKAELASGEIKGFDDLIGRPAQVKLKGGKDLGDDGKPKYVYFESVTSLHPKLSSVLDPLQDTSLGHIRLSQFDLKALDACSSFDVADWVIPSEEFKAGTHPANPLVEEKRKEDPNYAKPKPKETDGTGKPSGDETPTQGDAPKENLDAEEEF